MLCGGVSVHACAACGCEMHIVAVITLYSVKIAHRWKVRDARCRQDVLIGFDVVDPLCGNLAAIHRLSSSDSSARSRTLALFEHSE